MTVMYVGEIVFLCYCANLYSTEIYLGYFSELLPKSLLMIWESCAEGGMNFFPLLMGKKFQHPD